MTTRYEAVQDTLIQIEKANAAVAAAHNQLREYSWLRVGDASSNAVVVEKAREWLDSVDAAQRAVDEGAYNV